MKSFLAFNVSSNGAGKMMWKSGVAAAADAPNSETNPKSLFQRWVFALVCPLKIINLNQLSGRADNFFRVRLEDNLKVRGKQSVSLPATPRNTHPDQCRW